MLLSCRKSVVDTLAQNPKISGRNEFQVFRALKTPHVAMKKNTLWAPVTFGMLET